jgi:hypothetical protein
MKVTLAKNHTHAGKDFVPGDVIDVDAQTADWLKAQGVITRLKAIEDKDEKRPPTGRKE